MPGERVPRSADVAADAAVAAYLDLQALKAPGVITPGPRIRRYMTTGRAPAA